MSKFLFWAGVIIVVLFVMRLLARHNAAKARSQMKQASRATKRFEPMTQCAHCGVHLPTRDAIERDGKPFCSEAHARLGTRR